MAEVFEIDMVKDSTMQTMNAILAKMASGNADGLQPKSYQDVQSIVRLGLAPYVFCIGDVIEVARVSAIQATLGEHTGITGCSVDEDKFIAKMNEAGEKEYEFIRSESRSGICISEDEAIALDKVISPLVMKGQSIHHICTNNKSDIMFSEKTIYNYIEAGALSIKNIDLPRKVQMSI